MLPLAVFQHLNDVGNASFDNSLKKQPQRALRWGFLFPLNQLAELKIPGAALPADGKKHNGKGGREAGNECDAASKLLFF